MNKILKVSIILPYYEARYVLNKKIEKKNNKGNTLSDDYENETVKEIKYKQIGEREYDYIIITKSNKEIYIRDDQPGVQIVLGDDKNVKM